MIGDQNAALGQATFGTGSQLDPGLEKQPSRHIACYLGKGTSVKDAIDAASKRSAEVVASLEAVPFTDF